MVKKLFIYIFIYTLTIGCHTVVGTQEEEEIWPSETNTDESCVSNYMLDIGAPYLSKDGAGYYHIEWVGGYVQTFTTLSAETGSTDFSQKVYWATEAGIYYMSGWVSSINHASYTDENGLAHTVLATWEEQINDTIMVYAAFEDRCGYIYNDSLGVIVE